MKKTSTIHDLIIPPYDQTERNIGGYLHTNYFTYKFYCFKSDNFGRDILYYIYDILGVNISEDLTWTTHIQTQVNKARQRLYHLRQLREIQGLTSNPVNFLFRGHRKCIDSVHLSVVWKSLQSGLQSPAESRALS